MISMIPKKNLMQGAMTFFKTMMSYFHIIHIIVISVIIVIIVIIVHHYHRHHCRHLFCPPCAWLHQIPFFRASA